jgi:hypothetical protein
MAGPSFLDHDGKRILRLDYTGLTPPEVIAYMQDAKRLIAAEPRRSVRLLSIVAIHITEDVVRALQEFAAHNVPFVLASAIVGATSFQRAAILLTIASRGRLNLEVFDDEESAKEWLASR